MDVPPINFSSETKTSLKIGDKEYHSAYDFSLTEEEVEKARHDLHETEEKKIRKIQELRDKIAKDKDVNYRTDTPYLLRFLRARKYDCVKAYQCLKEAYKFRMKHPDTTHVPPNLEHLLNQNFFTCFPYTDEDGNVLLYIDADKWKCKETSFEEIIQVCTIVVDLITMNPRIQVNGIIAIFNMNGLNRHHIYSAVSTLGIRGITYGCQNLYPWRVKKILIVNTDALTWLLYYMICPFTSKKIIERAHPLGYDMKELHRYVNPALLPKKLGGYLEDNQCSVTQNILDNISYIKYERSFTAKK